MTASWVWLKTHTNSNWHGSSRWCLHKSFITPTISDQPRDCFRLFTQAPPVQRNLWLTSLSRVSRQHSSRPLFFKMSTFGHFPRVSLHLSPHPHLTNNVLWQQQQKYNNHYMVTFQSCDNYPVLVLTWIISLFFLGMIGYPTCIHQNYSTITYPMKKKHHPAFLGNSLRKLKASQDQRLGSQNHVQNPVIPAAHFAWIPDDHMLVIHSTRSKWRISKNSTTISQ